MNISLKFNVNNYFYHSDLENLNSEKTKNLSKNIIEIVILVNMISKKEIDIYFL